MMKALSLTQPYANLIRDGNKTIETRKWKTNYRGSLLICATKQKVISIFDKVIEPRGMAVCIVDVVSCRPMVKGDQQAACYKWNEKLWAWGLENLRVIEPFPVKGQLNIFNVDYDPQND